MTDRWDRYWGSAWGAGPASEPDHAGKAVGEYPDKTRETSPKVLKFTEVACAQVQKNDNALAKGKPSDVLDYRYASGVWLDIIASGLGIKRDGRSDEYLRKLLRIYSLHAYPRRRTVNNMLDALKAFDSGTPVFYTPYYPMAYTIQFGDITANEHQSVDKVNVMRLYRPTCYNAFAIVQFDDPFLWADQGGASVTTLAWGDLGTSYNGGRWNHIEEL